MSRKPISKKTRFEVFKRDKFTCQYCGASAPEIVLELDHIIPVASGGDSEIMNLLTSCYACNRGKSYRELSDQSALAKQKKQLDNLQERKEQLELLSKWRKGLRSLQTETEKIIITEIESKYDNQYSVSDSGISNIRLWLKKFTLNEIIESIEISASQYLQINNKGEFSHLSVSNYFDKIPKIAAIRKNNDPYGYICNYVKKVMRDRYGVDYNQLNYVKDWLQKYTDPKNDIEKIKDITRKNDNFKEWQIEIRELTNG